SLGNCDVPVRHHRIQNMGSTRGRSAWVHARVVDRARLRHAGQQRVLAEGQAAEGRAVVGTGGGGNTIYAEAGGDLAQIVGHDLVLGNGPLYLEGKDHAFHLVPASVRTAQEQ